MPSDSTKKCVSDALVFTAGAKGLKTSATVSALASGLPARDASKVIGTDTARSVNTTALFIPIKLTTKD
jgi:hypothetical protein